jgi:hypothetical protein
MKKNEVYTELSIQIGVLEAKVDKILELLLLEEQKPYTINQTVGMKAMRSFVRSLNNVT